MTDESRTVLVVDDSAAARYVMTRVLKEAGFTVIEAADGHEALLAANRHPDLVLLDVKLPDIDGLEVCQRLRNDPATASIPVLHVTAALGTSEYWAAALECGSDGFLSQPVEPIVLVATIRSILRTRAAENALREADRRKNLFLATLAHELRNPLAPIRSALEIMKRDPGEARTEGALVIVERQVAALTRLVDDLLDIARISSGTIRLRPERLSARHVIDGAIETVGPLLERKHLRVEIDCPADLWLLADDQRLVQVVVNLLHNAAKFSPDGAAIALSAGLCDGGALRFAVRDSGRGMDPRRLQDLFEPFLRGTNLEPECDTGLGLGLALVRQIVELHGGTVRGQSEGIGRGAEFEVLLPKERVVAAPAENGESETAAATQNGPRRIAVVDDNVDAADSLAMLLEIDGHEVRVAYDGLAAVDLAREFRPDLMLLDIGLPKLDGFEVARRIRAEHGSAIQLVAVTGFGQPDDRERAVVAGFNRHLVKPVTREQMASVIEQAEPHEGSYSSDG